MRTHRRTREAFFELAYGAADAVACLAAAGLLWTPLPAPGLTGGKAGKVAAGAAAAGAAAEAAEAAAEAEAEADAEAEAVQAQAQALHVWLG